MTATRWNTIYAGLGLLMAVILALLLWAVPVEDGIREWTGQLIPGFWMAWTFPVALFFWIIADLLIIMTLLAVRYPETPRVGILRIETTSAAISPAGPPPIIATLRRSPEVCSVKRVDRLGIVLRSTVKLIYFSTTCRVSAG